MTERKALKLALEALTNAYWPTESDLMPAHNIKECAEAITAIKQALAQPEQEPVAWITDWEGQYSSGKILDYIAHTRGGKVEYTPLYTTPPQRKPLTDEEIWVALGGIDCTRPMLIARAIEAAHNIKE
jgi:hypothetical protein